MTNVPVRKFSKSIGLKLSDSIQIEPRAGLCINESINFWNKDLNLTRLHLLRLSQITI